MKNTGPEAVCILFDRQKIRLAATRSGALRCASRLTRNPRHQLRTHAKSPAFAPVPAFILMLGFCLLACPPLSAGPTQDDVFKSIHDSVGKPTHFDSTPVILLAGGGGLVVVVLTLMSRRQQKVATPKPLNHTGRLMKEVLREVSLKPAELRQLKLLTEAMQREDGQEANPLTLLLCPSLLAKGLKAGPAKLDRKALAQMVRRMRLNQPDEK